MQQEEMFWHFADLGPELAAISDDEKRAAVIQLAISQWLDDNDVEPPGWRARQVAENNAEQSDR
jgi:hypothetical protein